MAVDLEERINYKIVGQNTPGGIIVLYTFGAVSFQQTISWNGVDDIDRLIRDAVPIVELRRLLSPPPPPPELPNVVGREGHIVLISIPDPAH